MIACLGKRFIVVSRKKRRGFVVYKLFLTAAGKQECRRLVMLPFAITAVFVTYETAQLYLHSSFVKACRQFFSDRASPDSCCLQTTSIYE